MKSLRFTISALLIVSGTSLAIAACSPSAKVVVTQPISPKMRKYDVVSIEPSGAGARESKAARRFKEELGRRLIEKGYFSQVDPDGGVVFRARVTNLELGDEVKRELSLKGKAEVTIEIKVQEASGTVLGHFTVVSKEPRKNEDDQPALRAVAAAADEVVAYLEKKLPVASQARAKPKPSTKRDAAAGEASGDRDEDTDTASERDASTTGEIAGKQGEGARSSESED